MGTNNVVFMEVIETFDESGKELVHRSLHQLDHPTPGGVKSDRREPAGHLRRPEQTSEDEGRDGSGNRLPDAGRSGEGSRDGNGIHDAGHVPCSPRPSGEEQDRPRQRRHSAPDAANLSRKRINSVPSVDRRSSSSRNTLAVEKTSLERQVLPSVRSRCGIKT